MKKKTRNFCNRCDSNYSWDMRLWNKASVRWNLCAMWTFSGIHKCPQYNILVVFFFFSSLTTYPRLWASILDLTHQKLLVLKFSFVIKVRQMTRCPHNVTYIFFVSDDCFGHWQSSFDFSSDILKWIFTFHYWCYNTYYGQWCASAKSASFYYTPSPLLLFVIATTVFCKQTKSDLYRVERYLNRCWEIQTNIGAKRVTIQRRVWPSQYGPIEYD